MVVVVDYDTGNLCSVENAIGRLGCEYTVSSDPRVIRAADRVILPGVGEASSAMQRLRDMDLVDTIKGLTQPVLGICIGLQLMCRRSDEGNTQCMSIFDAEVKRFSVPGLKVPHMGWNTIENLSSPLFRGLDEGSYIYYVHSFAPQICDQTIAVTIYGEPFSAALSIGNFFGTQFHPEKSGDIGEQILKNFIEL